MEMNPFISSLLVPAYLDAGTGSLIFQVLVASLVSAGVVFGGWMAQLRSFVSRVILRRAPEASSSDAAATESSSDDKAATAFPIRQNNDSQRKAA